MLAMLADWGELAAALTLFLASHAVPARPPIRSALIGAVGRPAYFVGYSVVSLAVLGWLIAAAASARFVELWPAEAWQRVVPAMLMPVACVLAVFGLTSPNPLSLSVVPAERFDAERPGIAGLVRHPILWATLLWSTAHLLPNGDLAHVVLFGTFALLSLFGMLLLDRRKQRRLGRERWAQLARRTALLPGAALAQGWRPRPTPADVLKLAAGLTLYAALALAHAGFAGVPAFS